MSGYFITASGTDIGKTLVTSALAWQLARAGRRVEAIKPIISGFSPHDAQSDAALLLQSMGRTVDAAAIDSISPWRFAAPLSPDMAAAQEGKTIDLAHVVSFCRGRAADADPLLIEGAGGVMAPISARATMLDFMAQLQYPVILVAGTYLGALSHTLTALLALASRGLNVQALVLSASPESAAPPQALLASLAPHLPRDLRTAIIPRLPPRAELWQDVPILTGIPAA